MHHNRSNSTMPSNHAHLEHLVHDVSRTWQPAEVRESLLKQPAGRLARWSAVTDAQYDLLWSYLLQHFLEVITQLVTILGVACMCKAGGSEWLSDISYQLMLSILATHASTACKRHMQQQHPPSNGRALCK